jgi:hypothetical protein
LIVDTDVERVELHALVAGIHGVRTARQPEAAQFEHRFLANPHLRPEVRSRRRRRAQDSSSFSLGECDVVEPEEVRSAATLDVDPDKSVSERDENAVIGMGKADPDHWRGGQDRRTVLGTARRTDCVDADVHRSQAESTSGHDPQQGTPRDEPAPVGIPVERGSPLTLGSAQQARQPGHAGGIRPRHTDLRPHGCLPCHECAIRDLVNVVDLEERAHI